jgi:hypothetical protein
LIAFSSVGRVPPSKVNVFDSEALGVSSSMSGGKKV